MLLLTLNQKQKFHVASAIPKGLNALIVDAKKVENIAPIAYHW